jgi:hypothetical protein
MNDLYEIDIWELAPCLWELLDDIKTPLAIERRQECEGKITVIIESVDDFGPLMLYVDRVHKAIRAINELLESFDNDDEATRVAYRARGAVGAKEKAA